MYRLINVLTLITIYFTYVIWDFFHHQLLERTLSKNMVWLGFFRYGNDFQYSLDIIILTVIFIGLMLYYLLKRTPYRIYLFLFALLTLVLGVFA